MTKHKTNIAFLGLGTMGFPIAGHISQHFPTRVWNRSTAKAKKWATSYTGTISQTAQEATKNADIVCMCLGRDEDVAEVVLDSDGILTSMPAKSLLIDHTTTSQDIALKVSHACAQKGIDFLDAPVSGGQIGAQKGELAIMVGGSANAFARAKPVFNSYGKRIVHMGKQGAGQIAKMINQVCVAHTLQGLAEGLAIAEKSNLNIEKLLDVISAGAAQSWQMENRAHTMCKREFDFGFALDWMIKDLGYALAQANSVNVVLRDTLGKIASTYEALAQAGHGKEDTSALIRQFDKN